MRREANAIWHMEVDVVSYAHAQAGRTDATVLALVLVWNWHTPYPPSVPLRIATSRQHRKSGIQ